MKKTTLFWTISCAALLLVLSACATNSASLTGNSWKLVSYGPVTGQVPAVANVETSLTFGTDGKISGKLGCNSMGGDYTVDGGNITFKNVYATEMACPDPQMAQESIAFMVLQNMTTFKIDGSTLTINSTDGKYTLTFVAIK
jgi:heat shock protein HslJ